MTKYNSDLYFPKGQTALGTLNNKSRGKYIKLENFTHFYHSHYKIPIQGEQGEIKKKTWKSYRVGFTADYCTLSSLYVCWIPAF